jgi:hypothetical protein
VLGFEAESRMLRVGCSALQRREHEYCDERGRARPFPSPHRENFRCRTGPLEPSRRPCATSTRVVKLLFSRQRST